MIRIYDFAREFEEQHFLDDIPARVRKTEFFYWIGVAIGLALAMTGMVFLAVTPAADAKAQQIIGALLVLEGVVIVFGVGVATTVQVAMYYIIWDRRRHMDAEQLTVEAHDL